MKKFEEVQMNQNNPKWSKSIEREEKLYNPVFGTKTMRTEFDRDYTRLINCNAYKRLKHKTQVFFAPQNDHICTRIEHVNLVESISHTIANYLGLNLELTKAIAVAHDIGHAPFGHQGEFILSTISEREYKEKFWHAKNGLHYVEDLELLKDYSDIKRNLNLTYAVRDGIIGHSGEPDKNGLKPRKEAIELSQFKRSGEFNPYTWEGCVVKIADNISYMGRDIEDAIQMNLLTEKEVAKFDELTEHVKISNSNIINYLVVDLCENSSVETGLKFSEEALDTMYKIKKFNNENIYQHKVIKPTIRYFTVLINELFYALRNEYDGKNTIKNLKKMRRYYPVLASEFSSWLSNYAITEDRDNKLYDNKIIYNLEKLENYNRAIVDYMSGMTDIYIVKIYNELINY
jgi:dGTPase